MKYDLASIMRRAWAIFRKAATKAAITFGEALRRAWAVVKVAPANAAKVEAARVTAGINQMIDSWAGWQSLGFEVIHGSHTVLQVMLDDPARGLGKTRIVSFFAADQVVPLGSQG